MRFIGWASLVVVLIGGGIALVAFFPSASPHDRGYSLGISAGSDCVKDVQCANTQMDAAVAIYMLRDRVEGESEEFKQGYREGFRKGYDDHLMDGFYRR